jgi:hypothetical protein
VENNKWRNKKKKTEKTCLGVRNVFFLLLLGNPGEKKLKK